MNQGERHEKEMTGVGFNVATRVYGDCILLSLINTLASETKTKSVARRLAQQDAAIHVAIG